MRQHQKMHRFSKTIMAGLITGGALLALPALAQMSSATIRGQITQQGAPVKAPVQIVATNKATGVAYKATTQVDGSYVLLGLAPGSYTISVIGSKEKSQDVTLQVGETAAIDLALSSAAGVSLEQVQIVGSLQRKDVKNSEAGTSVSARQIEVLPQVTRNFLAFADLAPGVRFVQSDNGYTRIQGGAQGSDRVNVFLDGVSQKNDVSRGGIMGQNESRGNPFPQSAIAEYKVITQNYKAEYGSVSSTAITAVSKSGSNELHGDAFVDYVGGRQIAYSPFEMDKENSGTPRPPAKQIQYGASISGAITPDKLHYFFSYEGKDNTVPVQSTVAPGSLNGITKTPIVQQLLDKQYSATRPFHEDLVFGKLNLAINDEDRLELTAKLRSEYDQSMLGSDMQGQGYISSRENTQNRTQDEARLDLKWERSTANWLNEARIGYESSHFVPQSDSKAPFTEYKTVGWSNILWDGGVISAEEKKQRGLLLQDDFTYSGIAAHILKTGAKFKSMNYSVLGTRAAVPHQFIFIDNNGVANPLVDNDGNAQWFLTGAPLNPPWEPLSATGQPLTGAEYRNNQVGLYFQDDWSVSKNLEINWGLRWDYEDNAMNNKYVTPTAVVNALTGADTRGGAPTGRTYAQSLALGGININDFISTGSNRDAFTGAWQPRLGFSYDLFANKESVIVGGIGRAYDRTPASKAQDEVVNNALVGGEIWLLKNSMKMPYSDQFSLSLRQKVADWDAEVGVRQVRGYNEFVWYSGGRDVNGVAGTGAPFDQAGGLGPAGWGNLLLGDTVNETRTTVAFLSATKPYTKSSGWGVGATYTRTRAQTTATLAESESSATNQYSWGVGQNNYGTTLRDAIDVEKHRIVLDASSDRLLPWGIMVGTKVTAGSSVPFWVTSCAAGWGSGCQRYTAEGAGFRQIDLMLLKDVKVPGIGSGDKLTFRLDVINLLNHANYGTYETWAGGPTSTPANQWGGDNATAGQPKTLAGPMRTVKVGLKYAF